MSANFDNTKQAEMLEEKGQGSTRNDVNTPPQSSQGDAVVGGYDADSNVPVSQMKWWTDEEEAAVRRKLDRRILPMLFIIYGLAYLDRSNVGNANTAGMKTALGYTTDQYRLVTVLFYVAYIAFQSLLLVYLIVPAHIWVAACAFVWGLSSTLQSTAFNLNSLLAARFFTGLAEAGFGTGIALYLGFFYPRREVGFRFAVFVTSSAFASAIGGALAYGLVRASSSVAGWKLLFIVEGCPNFIISILIFFLLPDNPKHCRKFLTERETAIAEARLFKPAPTQQSQPGHAKIMSHIKSKMDKKSFIYGLTSPVAWLTALLLLIINVGYGSVPIFLPQVIAQSGTTAVKAQGLTAPPYIIAWLFALSEVYLSDRLQHRAGFMFFNLSVGIAGYVLLAIVDDFNTRYAAVFLVSLGLFAQVPLTYILLITNSSSEKSRGIGLSILGTVSQTGPLIGNLAVFGSGAPYYHKGMWVATGILCAGVVIAITAFSYFLWANGRRDSQMRRREEAFSSGHVDEKTLGIETLGSREQERLACKFKLDMSVPAEKEEALRRLIDVGKRGEDSEYFRYIY